MAQQGISVEGLTCSVSECDKALRTVNAKWCNAHYLRWWKYGDPLAVRQRGGARPRPDQSGAKNPNYKGDEASYATVHYRVKKARGHASEWMCVHCAAPADEWAYTHEAREEKIDERGRPFSLDVDDYIPLCISCHRSLDGA